MKIIFSKHAEIEMELRKIERRATLKIIRNPQQKFKSDDTLVCQSKYFDNRLKKEMLLRVFIKKDIKGLKIIIVYKTSKIDKYWVKE